MSLAARFVHQRLWGGIAYARAGETGVYYGRARRRGWAVRTLGS